VFLSAAFRKLSLVLDPGGRLGGKAGSACEEFVDNKCGILGYCF